MLSYTISGEGQNVLFLHGFMENSTMWQKLIPVLNIRAISVDLHGHGNSFFDPKTPPSISTMAEQVMEIVQHENLKNCIIVGHSLGGYVALELMRQAPDFEHIVLFHSHPWSDSLEKQADRRRVAEMVKTKAAMFIREAIPNLFYQPEKFTVEIEQYQQMALQMNPEAIGWAALAMAAREDTTSTLLQHTEKFTVVIGDKDKLVNAGVLEKFCLSENLNHVVFKNTGHMAHLEYPEHTIEFFKTVLG